MERNIHVFYEGAAGKNLLKRPLDERGVSTCVVNNFLEKGAVCFHRFRVSLCE